MKYFALLISGWITVVALTGQGRQTTFVVSNVTLIDGTGKAAQPNMRVTIANGRIESVEPQESRVTDDNGAVIDGAGKFLMPGLWDSHVHLVDVGEEAIPALLAYGITSVRDMGGDPSTLQTWRRRIERDEMRGPRIRFCGPMLEGKWDPTSVGGRTDHWVVASPAEARPMVERLAAAGVDCIKFRSFASPETYFALAAAAREKGLPFAGHPPGNLDPIATSNAGQRSYEHAFYPWPWDKVPAEQQKQIAATFRKNGSVVVPTLIAWNTYRLTADAIAAVVNDFSGASDARLKIVSPSLRRNWNYGVEDFRDQNSGSPGWHAALDKVYQQVAELHEQGVGIMAGTDTGVALVYPGSALHQELELLVSRSRFTPMDALLSATLVPAKFFGVDGDVGTIQKGKRADMLLLSANPLADIRNVKAIDGVFSRGQWFDRSSLASILSDVERAIARTRPKANAPGLDFAVKSPN